ncbi:hypothetical protein ANN_26343 [Periplaneta americana]|uniref:Uncharacterized protein n=1 Tax=Periplaneta americana TaxID=6978 RepID=A0ABQ8S605_PERAM|nr:hypothetical protein ANN_26343 [Periplaneta americana]
MAGLCEGGNEPPSSLKAITEVWATCYCPEMLQRADAVIPEDRRITSRQLYWRSLAKKVWMQLSMLSYMQREQEGWGPYIFDEQTITRDTYLDMLQLFLQPQLLQDVIIDTVVLQQDGAPPHFALTVREYLNEMFPTSGQEGHLLLSEHRVLPTSHPWTFLLRGSSRNRLYRTKVLNLQVLQKRIRQASEMITVDMLANVFRATVRRWEMYFEIDGDHVED